jgi:hypothetical protein
VIDCGLRAGVRISGSKVAQELLDDLKRAARLQLAQFLRQCPFKGHPGQFSDAPADAHGWRQRNYRKNAQPAFFPSRISDSPFGKKRGSQGNFASPMMRLLAKAECCVRKEATSLGLLAR